MRSTKAPGTAVRSHVVATPQPAPDLGPGSLGLSFANPGLAGLMDHGPDVLAECLAELLHAERDTLLPLLRRVRDPWARLRCLNALAVAETLAQHQGQPTELDERPLTRLRRLAAGAEQL
jgi:hypothetical protein